MPLNRRPVKDLNENKAQPHSTIPSGAFREALIKEADRMAKRNLGYNYAFVRFTRLHDTNGCAKVYLSSDKEGITEKKPIILTDMVTEFDEEVMNHILNVRGPSVVFKFRKLSANDLVADMTLLEKPPLGLVWDIESCDEYKLKDKDKEILKHMAATPGAYPEYAWEGE